MPLLSRFPRPHLQRLLRRPSPQDFQRIRRILLGSVQFVAISYLATIHIGEAGVCTGPSMLPTLAADTGLLFYVRLPFLQVWRDGMGRLPWSSSASSSSSEGHSSSSTSGEGFTLSSSKSLSRRTCNLPLSIGDIVVSAGPHDPQKQVCKRILGLPGDRVLVDPRPGEKRRMTRAGVRIFEEERRGTGGVGSGSGSGSSSGSSGSKLSPLPVIETARGPQQQEKALHLTQRRGGGGEEDGDEDEEGYFTVPPGHVWLAGDNLHNSTDSRDYGPVPMGCLRGKVIARVSKGRGIHLAHCCSVPLLTFCLSSHPSLISAIHVRTALPQPDPLPQRRQACAIESRARDWPAQLAAYGSLPTATGRYSSRPHQRQADSRQQRASLA